MSIKPSPKTERPSVPQEPQKVSHRRGLRTHTVAPGETLWRISKIYDVPLASILNANNVQDDADLQMGQTLDIPGAKAPEQIITLFPSDKWEYIIVHHSATPDGNSLKFNEFHLNKGWDGIGYHFVIDNGKSGKPDGFIEITPRWLKQVDGAHCKASEMNTKAIGICLVGNFNETSTTEAQINSLIFLLNKLQDYYKIPVKKILGHKDVEGSSTECPGQNFPWKRVKNRL